MKATAVDAHVIEVKKDLASQVRACFAMTKPTVSMLVVVTVVPGVLLATGGAWPEPLLVLAAILGTYCASASAAMFNHLVEIDSDAQMERTKSRPIQEGRISATTATLVAAALAVASLLILTFGATPMAAIVALVANLFYVVGYTMFLKRNTDQNIVIGGAAGGVGPLIGWAAVTGDIGAPAWALFGLVFMWTPPHFWALSLKYKDDYARAGIPMLPVTRGEEYTRKSILAYTWLLLPTMFFVNFYCDVSAVFAAFSYLLTAIFVVLASKLHHEHSNKSAMQLFHYSCFYLFALFCGLTIDKLWQLI